MSEEMLSTAYQYFTDNGYPVNAHDELPILRLEYEGENGRWYCYARVLQDRDQFLFLSVLTDLVPKKRRAAVAEYLIRINFVLNLGNFEMDFSDGEVRFRASIDVTHATLTSGLIDPLVRASWVVVDQYLPGLKAVVAGTTTPAKAVKSVVDDDSDVDLDLSF